MFQKFWSVSKLKSLRNVSELLEHPLFVKSYWEMKRTKLITKVSRTHSFLANTLFVSLERRNRILSHWFFLFSTHGIQFNFYDDTSSNMFRRPSFFRTVLYKSWKIQHAFYNIINYNICLCLLPLQIIIDFHFIKQ